MSGGKYGASPDVRNAVMDYYKSDKKDTTANLSALLSTVRRMDSVQPALCPPFVHHLSQRMPVTVPARP